MASLNDFFRMEVKSAPRRRSLAPGRYLFLIQLLVAALLVLGVWQFGDKQNTLGLAARYIKEEGLSAASAWLPMEEIFPAAAQPQNASPPQFSPPLSGTTVRDFAASAAENSDGVLIKGAEGDGVKAAAAGIVQQIDHKDGVYTITLSHADDFTTIYGSLGAVNVQKGDSVEAGAVIATLSGDTLSFSMQQKGISQDPLAWLFNGV